MLKIRYSARTKILLMKVYRWNEISIAKLMTENSLNKKSHRKHKLYNKSENYEVLYARLLISLAKIHATRQSGSNNLNYLFAGRIG